MYCPFANSDCVMTNCGLWVKSQMDGESRCALAQIAVTLEKAQDQITQIKDLL